MAISTARGERLTAATVTMRVRGEGQWGQGGEGEERGKIQIIFFIEFRVSGEDYPATRAVGFDDVKSLCNLFCGFSGCYGYKVIWLGEFYKIK